MRATPQEVEENFSQCEIGQYNDPVLVGRERTYGKFLKDLGLAFQKRNPSHSSTCLNYLC